MYNKSNKSNKSNNYIYKYQKYFNKYHLLGGETNDTTQKLLLEKTNDTTQKLLLENTNKLNQLISLGNSIISNNPNIIERNMSGIPIYYINLDRSVKRNKWMVSQFEKYHITNYTRIAAVDGSKLTSLTQGNYQDLINYQVVNPGEFVTFNSGVLGCCLSHLYAILQAYLNRDKYVIIMEDDCNLCLIPFWKQSLNKLIQKAPPNWRLLQLVSSSKDCLSDDLVSNKYYSGRFCKSTATYIINRSGMKYLLDHLYDLPSNTFFLRNSVNGVKPLLHADWFIFQYLLDDLYHTLPLFCLNNNDLPSELGHNDIGHVNANLMILRYYLKK